MWKGVGYFGFIILKLSIVGGKIENALPSYSLTLVDRQVN
jgi:hypothetical protein